MIAPIETTYKGNKYRSRIEARHAVFFEHLKISYEYESQGYQMDNVYYLPDFYLPLYETFIEIKGKLPEPDELEKAKRLSKELSAHVVIFHGSFSEEPMVGTAYFCGEPLENGAQWVECKKCHHVDILPRSVPCLWCHYSGNEAVLRRASLGLSLWCKTRLKTEYTPSSKSLRDASLAAQQARFEHGQSG